LTQKKIITANSINETPNFLITRINDPSQNPENFINRIDFRIQIEQIMIQDETFHLGLDHLRGVLIKLTDIRTNLFFV
jgi:hypothetical protein